MQLSTDSHVRWIVREETTSCTLPRGAIGGVLWDRASRMTVPQRYALRRQRQVIVTAIAFVLWLPFGAHCRGGHALESRAGGLMALVALVAYAVFSFRNWRCPACDGSFGRALDPRFCPECGVALQ